MADLKISGLTDGAPAQATDQLAIARAGATLRLTLADLQGLASATSADVAAVSNAISNETSARNSAVNVVSNALSNEISNRVSADGVLAAAVNVVSNALSDEISVRTSAVNAVSNILSALIVDHNTLSNRVSANSGTGGAGSVTSAEVVAAVAVETSNRTSADGVLAAAINVVSNALSDEISIRTSAVNAVSNVVSALIVAHDALSNRVSANSGTGGAGSVTSNEVSAVSATAAAAINVVSNAVSVLTSALNRVKVLTGDFTVSSGALIDVSGLGLTLETIGGIYEMTGGLFVRYTSTAAAAVGFGLTFPGMKVAGGTIEGLISISGSNINAASGQATRAWFNEEASGSIILSVIPAASASATRNLPVLFRGTFVVSTAGVLQMQARSSSGLTTSAPVIAANSYLRVVKVA